MEKNATLEIGEKFQHAFASVCEDQIQQLIEETRQEALAQAKQILRVNALNNVLEAVVGENLPAANASKAPDPVRHRVQQMPAPTPKKITNAPPALNDRILEEIEAIREQIRRNELLLSQIKPFVQTSKIQEK